MSMEHRLERLCHTAQEVTRRGRFKAATLPSGMADRSNILSLAGCIA
ncbi:MAG: hypothetical protein RMM98_08420 [Acidobacteriota bacterium]|nr:hypothetical protein [Blastocatellia bacterium]MDW8239626.1 hypothetical protein [Acidobacteriota bacterium]